MYPCDSGIQKAIIIDDDKYRDYLVVSAEESTGQHDKLIHVVISKHHARKMMIQLTEFLKEDGPNDVSN
jgi:hypothetical protein